MSLKNILGDSRYITPFRNVLELSFKVTFHLIKLYLLTSDGILVLINKIKNHHFKWTDLSNPLGVMQC